MKLIIIPLIYLGSFCVIIKASGGNDSNGVKYDTQELKSQRPASGNYNSGQCLPSSSIEVASNIDQNFFNRRRLWYTTGSTRGTYLAISNILLGRYNVTTDQRELERMCHTRTFGKLFSEPVDTIFNGYGVQFVISSVPTDRLGQFTASVNLDPKTFDGKLGVNPYLGYPDPIPVYLVKTDNRSYSIFYLCFGTVPDIALNTVTPFVSPAVAKIYKEMVLKMQIDPKDVVLLPCSLNNQGSHSQQFNNSNHLTGGWSRQ